MFRNNQNDLNYSPQEVGFGGPGYAGGAPVIAPTFISTPSGGTPFGYAPPIAPVAPVLAGGCGNNGFFGGIAPVGLVGIGDVFGRDRNHGHDHGHTPFPFPNPCKDDDNGNFAILAAVAASKETTVAEGRAVLAGLANNKDVTVAEARAISNAICESEKTNLTQFNALAIQASNNTQSIKDQATLQHAAILAAINNSEVQRLRDELHNERRGRDLDVIRIENNNTNTNVQAQFQAQAQAQLQRDYDEHRRRFDNREIEINNINTNTNVQAQLQAQAQAQILRERDRDHDFCRRFDALFSQQNRVAQDIVNIGSGIVGANQTSTPTNNEINK